MTSPIQEIKDRLDIVEFIRSYIPLQPAGKNLKALCPFHKEKTPSFMVSAERQMWHCFGACSEGGDIFKFLMKYENLEFYEALKILAEKAGIELRKISPAEHKQFGILFDINESAKNFFKKELEHSSEAMSYLGERGLHQETIGEFELGLSPADFDSLGRHLINSGYDFKDVERAGLSYKTERGNYVDRFRGRIMFPIYNHFGKVVGFSGRILPRLELEKPELGKYINSPETPIFNKSRVLYGFHKTKNNIREQKSVVLVEGQMDFLMAYQDGVKNAVATSGTALTVSHLRTLRRMTDQLIFCFDNDEAGLKAAERAIDLAGSTDFNVKVLTLKDCKDPAEVVEKSPGALAALINETPEESRQGAAYGACKPAMEFYFDRYLPNTDLHGSETDKRGHIGELKRNIRIILGKIKNLVSPVEQAHWVKELSLLIKIGEKALLEEMAQLKTLIAAESRPINAGDIGINSLNQYKSASRRELIAQRLISLTNIKEDFLSQINDYLDYLPADYLVILKNLNQQVKLEDERLINLLNLISLRSSFEASILEGGKIEQEFQELLRQLRLEYFKEKREGLSRLIKEAEQKGEEERVTPALKEFNEISKMISKI